MSFSSSPLNDYFLFDQGDNLFWRQMPSFELETAFLGSGGFFAIDASS
jgi:hypothetical protein